MTEAKIKENKRKRNVVVLSYKKKLKEYDWQDSIIAKDCLQRKNSINPGDLPPGETTGLIKKSGKKWSQL